MPRRDPGDGKQWLSLLQHLHKQAQDVIDHLKSSFSGLLSGGRGTQSSARSAILGPIIPLVGYRGEGAWDGDKGRVARGASSTPVREPRLQRRFRVIANTQQAWQGISIEQLLEELHQIQQFVLLYPPLGEKGPNRIATVLSKQTLPQQALAKVFGLEQLHTNPRG